MKRNVLVSTAIIRPTGLLDPIIILKPSATQVDDIMHQMKALVLIGQRAIITTLTKKFAEELDLYFKQMGIKSCYIHSDIQALDRLDILADLRRGKYDVIIGINLLREGIDLPEVSLVAIFDADKEGFLRSSTALIQTIGRAARHSEGKVIMYADKITRSMQIAIDETQKRRDIQNDYNQKMGIIPKSTTRHISDIKKDLIEEEIIEETKLSYDLNNLVIDNRNSQKSVMGRKGRSPKKQVFSDFETIKALKEQEIESLSKSDLKERLQIAIDCMDFEMAAAIRDKLNP